MGDAADIMGDKRAQNLPGGADYANTAIIRAEKKAVRAGAETADFVVLEEGQEFGLLGVVIGAGGVAVGGGEFDLADLEKVESFPLETVRRVCCVSWAG